MVTEIEELDKIESILIEKLVEQFLQDEDVQRYVRITLESYELDFDINGPLTGLQEELICQYQNFIHHRILAQMIRTV